MVDQPDVRVVESGLSQNRQSAVLATVIGDNDFVIRANF